MTTLDTKTPRCAGRPDGWDYEKTCERRDRCFRYKALVHFDRLAGINSYAGISVQSHACHTEQFEAFEPIPEGK